MTVLGLPVPQSQLGERLQDDPLLTAGKAVNKHLVTGLGNRKAGVLVIVCRTAGHIPVLPNLPELLSRARLSMVLPRSGFCLRQNSIARSVPEPMFISELRSNVDANPKHTVRSNHQFHGQAIPPPGPLKQQIWGKFHQPYAHRSST